MIVTEYDNDATIKFYCDRCDFHGEYNINSLLEDNCVLDIDVVCELCGAVYVLYITKCTDPVEAKLLQARLEFLKDKRAAEDKENGNQKHE